jgi:hypothetical protein
MICSSVNLFFTSNLLSGGLDSKFRRDSNQGGRWRYPGGVGWMLRFIWIWADNGLVKEDCLTEMQTLLHDEK